MVAHSASMVAGKLSGRYEKTVFRKAVVAASQNGGVDAGVRRVLAQAGALNEGHLGICK